MLLSLSQVSIWLLSLSSTLALTTPRATNEDADLSEKDAFIESLVAQMMIPEMGA